jgi:sortase A
MVGWVLLGCGVGLLLYIVYALLFTNVAAGRAQQDLRTQWDQRITTATSAEPEPSTPPVRGVALIEFARPGRSAPLVHDEPLVVLNGVAVDDLQRGPGHYPGTALPGRNGNFAVAGHRTTYGAPFFHLDSLRPGDQVLVTDRRGRHYTYEVAEQRVVLPTDTSVIGEDPLGTGRPTLTLTTCNPRFSAAERLIVHAQLVS